MKAIKKILLFILNLIGFNQAELCLLIVFISSITPFFSDKHGEMFYTCIGGYFAFCSMLFIHLYDDDKKPRLPKNVYGASALLILAIGLSAMYFLKGKTSAIDYTPFELFITTYFGAMLGLMMGLFVFGTMFNHKEWGKKKDGIQ